MTVGLACSSTNQAVLLSGLVARPSHVFQCMREKLGRPGQFGDVMMTYLPPFLPWFIEMVPDISSLHHQIDQAFPIFLACVEKHGKAWVPDLHLCKNLLKRWRKRAWAALITCGH